MTKTPLSLNPETEGNSEQPESEASGQSSGQSPGQAPVPPENPVVGWFAVGFGFLGIFINGPVFVPLTLICSVVALFMRQASWAFIGLLLTVVGFMMSPVLLALVGLAWFSNWVSSLF